MSDWQEIERTALEEALRQMPAGVVIAEAPSGKIVFVNREAQRWTEQKLGLSMPTTLEDAAVKLEIFHPDGRLYEAEEWPLIRSVTSGEEVRDWEGYFSLADGTQRWFRGHSSPVYDEEGRIVAGAMVGREITEQKQAEEKLAYHASLLENIHDAVIATDEHLLVTAWNKGAEQMYGWRADEALGRNVWEAVPVDMSEEQRAQALGELAEKGRFRTEAITHAKDGTPVWVEGITIALRGGEQGEGEITGYVNIRRDITERKEAEEALRESKRRI